MTQAAVLGMAGGEWNLGDRIQGMTKTLEPDKRIKSSKAGGRRVLSGLTEGDGGPKEEMRSVTQQPVRQGRPVAQKNGLFPRMRWGALEHFKEDSDMIYCLERDYDLTAGSFINERTLASVSLAQGLLGAESRNSCFLPSLSELQVIGALGWLSWVSG